MDTNSPGVRPPKGSQETRATCSAVKENETLQYVREVMQSRGLWVVLAILVVCLTYLLQLIINFIIQAIKDLFCNPLMLICILMMVLLLVVMYAHQSQTERHEKLAHQALSVADTHNDGLTQMMGMMIESGSHERDMQIELDAERIKSQERSQAAVLGFQTKQEELHLKNEELHAQVNEHRAALDNANQARQQFLMLQQSRDRAQEMQVQARAIEYRKERRLGVLGTIGQFFFGD